MYTIYIQAFVKLNQGVSCLMGVFFFVRADIRARADLLDERIKCYFCQSSALKIERREVFDHIYGSWDCLSFSILSFAQVAPPCVEWCNVLYVDLSEELVGDCDLDCSQSLF